MNTERVLKIIEDMTESIEDHNTQFLAVLQVIKQHQQLQSKKDCLAAQSAKQSFLYFIDHYQSLIICR